MHRQRDPVVEFNTPIRAVIGASGQRHRDGSHHTSHELATEWNWRVHAFESNDAPVTVERAIDQRDRSSGVQIPSTALVYRRGD